MHDIRYRVPDPRTREQFEIEGTIVEVRGNRHCTVFPDSVYESGEAVEFDSRYDYDPGPSTWSALRKAASNIAIATVLFKAWGSGQRHDWRSAPQPNRRGLDGLVLRHAI